MGLRQDETADGKNEIKLKVYVTTFVTIINRIESQCLKKTVNWDIKYFLF